MAKEEEEEEEEEEGKGKRTDSGYKSSETTDGIAEQDQSPK